MKKKSIKKCVKYSGFAVALGAVCMLGAWYFSGTSEAETVTGKTESTAGETAIDGWKAADADKEYMYCVASVSKIYSTAAVMKLAEEGKVSLDSPVMEYIPEFRMADPRYKDITVRMLMNHTSGIMGTCTKGMLLYNDDDSLHQDEFLKNLSTQRLKADPGKYASYCNDGFDLLGIIAERVSGLTFADFIKKYLVTPTGGSSTETGFTVLGNKDLVPGYTAGHTLYENGLSTAIGAGGVFSTASDVAKFGSGFFYGNNALFSDFYKKAMAKRWDDKDEFTDGCGLGWDSVSVDEFKEAGVDVLGKGGDDGLNHSYLLVAPDNKISVSVLANGGSSVLNGLVAQEILKVCLEEKGISVTEKSKNVPEIVTEIPEKYDAYAGSYIVASSTGEVIDRISFPDHRYMHVEEISPYNTTYADYALTSDGRFTELAYEVSDSGIDDIKLAVNPQSVSFTDAADGKVLLNGMKINSFPEIGSYEDKSYVGERMEENPVSEEVLSSWQAMNGAELCLTGDIYSSSLYDTANGYIILPKDYPGYVFVVHGLGTRLLKIVDERHLVAFQTIPSSRSRDLIDAEIVAVDNEMQIHLSNNSECIFAAELPVFDGSEKEISLSTGQAKWYRIGDAVTNSEVQIEERPEKSAVYVYNKFGDVVYTSHVVGITDVVPMPEGGKILFLGETGGMVKIK